MAHLPPTTNKKKNHAPTALSSATSECGSSSIHLADDTTDVSSDDDSLDWCTPATPEDIDEHHPQPLSIGTILETLSEKKWPHDLVARYGTLEEEILSHKIIFSHTWIRVHLECTKAVMV